MQKSSVIAWPCTMLWMLLIRGHLSGHYIINQLLYWKSILCSIVVSIELTSDLPSCCLEIIFYFYSIEDPSSYSLSIVLIYKSISSSLSDMAYCINSYFESLKIPTFGLPILFFILSFIYFVSSSISIFSLHYLLRVIDNIISL